MELARESGTARLGLPALTVDGAVHTVMDLVPGKPKQNQILAKKQTYLRRNQWQTLEMLHIRSLTPHDLR